MKKTIILITLLLLCMCVSLTGLPSCAETTDIRHAVSYSEENVNGNDTAVIDTSNIPIIKPGDKVICGGAPIGIKYQCDGVMICGISEVDAAGGNVCPGDKADIDIGDVITHVNGIPVSGIDSILSATKASCGNEIRLTVENEGKRDDKSILPAKSVSEDEYRLGLWLKDSTAGIGTVTYIIPETGYFAGLGHGICDQRTSKLLPLRVGIVSEVTVNSIVKGESKSPGELKGCFGKDIGTLSSNTHRGIFGFMDKDEISGCNTTAVLAEKNDVHEGQATILCALDGSIISSYDINIEKIDRNSKDTKNFIIKVTDKALINKTGGIVQGMSGSPIIQDGKLVGAVTHVLVNDPTRGYGIFIENMLEVANTVAEEQQMKDAS